jgi:hypothetical protein
MWNAGKPTDDLDPAFVNQGGRRFRSEATLNASGSVAVLVPISTIMPCMFVKVTMMVAIILSFPRPAAAAKNKGKQSN